MAKLERDGPPKALADARQLFAEMEQLLAQMEVDYAGAHERLARPTVDEPSLAKVKKDAPM
jgi:hypothetical protein